MMDQQQEDNKSYEDEDKVIQKSKYVKIGFFIFIAYFLWMEHRAHVIEYLPFIILAACPLMHFFMHKDHGHHDPHGNDKNGKKG
jgi:DUF2933 family protein